MSNHLHRVVSHAGAEAEAFVPSRLCQFVLCLVACRRRHILLSCLELIQERGLGVVPCAQADLFVFER